MSQQLSPNTVLPYCVPRGTTHLMMWFGSMLPEERVVRYNSEGKYTYEAGQDEDERFYVNYVETLQEECKKMQEKGEACILVYDSRFLSLPDKQKLQDIVSSIPNCYLVDYKEFVEKVRQEPDIKYNKQPVQISLWFNDAYILKFEKNRQSSFIEDIENIIETNTKKQIFDANLTKNSIGNLVDCAKMLLLHHPMKLKELAMEKNSNKSIQLNPKDCALLYHDFDLIQKTQTDIQHTQNQQNLQQNIKLDKNKPYLIFQKDIRGIALRDLEHSLILAISPNDKNERIDDIWCWYLNYVFRDDMPLYYIAGIEKDEKVRPLIMDGSGHWKDEEHLSWQIKPRKPQHIVKRNTQSTENKQDINKNKENNKENNENKEEDIKIEEGIENNIQNSQNEQNEQNDKTIKEAYIQSNSYEGNEEEDKKEEITNQPRRTIKHQQKLTNNKDCKKPPTLKQWLQKKNKQKKEEQKKTKELSKKMRKYQYNLYHAIDSKRCIDIKNPYTNYKPVYADISNRTSSYHCHFQKGGKKNFPDKY